MTGIEALQSVQFVTKNGKRLAVLSAEDWEALTEWLETLEDAQVAREAFARLKTTPDVTMCDGHGYAHPRRFGYACHVGLWLGIPTLGCAKSVLVGQYREPGQKRGCVAPLRDRDEVIGMAVRTRDATQPVYASVGNFIDLPSAVRVILESARGYRIPEPTRQAHVHVNLLRRQGLGC